MPKLVNLYLDTLKKAGYRITEQRQQICQYLTTTDKHPTPYEVYAEISSQHPEISRATVYNTLNTLQRLGAIVEISIGADHTHYDTNPAPHINLICLRCHAVEDYQPTAGPAVIPELGNEQPLLADPQQCLGHLAQDDSFQQTISQLGFQPMAARIDVLGLCRRCQLTTQQEN